MPVSMNSILPLPQTPPLGHPVPNSSHAVSVQLPTWDDIKEMFTGAARVKSVQLNGYPRSFLNTYVKQMHKICIETFANPSVACFLFPSFEYAQECRRFVISEKLHGENALPPHAVYLRSIDVDLNTMGEDPSQRRQITLHGVFSPANRPELVHVFWRLVGVGMSSRLAQHCLTNMHSLSDVTGNADRPPQAAVCGRFTEAPHRILCQRIAMLLERASITNTRKEPVARDDVYLYPSGMAAIYHAQQALLAWRGTESVVFGFPYELTLKLLETYGPPVKFYPFIMEADMDDLEAHLAQKATAGHAVQAIWCECPSNPLLRTPDFRRLRALADRYEAAVVVDETIGGFANVDLLDVADMLVTSLTKSFNGAADVMAGSIVLNSASRFYADWKIYFEQAYTNCLFTADAAQLEENSRSLLLRTQQINETASYLVSSLQTLQADPASVITGLYYPEIDSQSENYRGLMRRPTQEFSPGYGGLFTIQFEDVRVASVFFNNLNIHKGPSLGANVTLAQPYVQTVFHKQKAWAAECGLHESIVRVSVGLEDKHALLAAFRVALAEADRARVETIEEQGVESEHSGSEQGVLTGSSPSASETIDFVNESGAKA